MDTKKGAIQLTMNFIVMLIIAIVIFILSLFFLTDFFIQAGSLQMALDEQTRSQIESMLAGNARVAIPIETRRIRLGDSTSFGVGIRNSATNAFFRVEIGDAAFIHAGSQNAVPLNCNEGDCSESASLTLVTYQIGRLGEIKIPMNNDDIVLLAFGTTRNAQRGHFIFDVRICAEQNDYPANCDGDLYTGNVYKLHLIVS